LLIFPSERENIVHAFDGVTAPSKAWTLYLKKLIKKIGLINIDVYQLYPNEIKKTTCG